MFCTLNSIKANLRTCQNTMKKFVKFSLFTFKLRIADNLSFWRDFFWNSVECPVLLEFCKLVIMVYLKPDGDLFCWQRAERNFLWIWIPELWWKPGCKTWFFSGLTTQDYKRSERHACMPFAGEDFVCQWPKINAARGDECKQWTDPYNCFDKNVLELGRWGKSSVKSISCSAQSPSAQQTRRRFVLLAAAYPYPEPLHIFIKSLSSVTIWYKIRAELPMRRICTLPDNWQSKFFCHKQKVKDVIPRCCNAVNMA